MLTLFTAPTRSSRRGDLCQRRSGRRVSTWLRLPQSRVETQPIGVGDLLNGAITAGNSTNRYLEPLTMVRLRYLGISVPLTIALRLAETRMAARWESYAA